MRVKGLSRGPLAFVLAVVALVSCNKDVEFRGASADKVNPEAVSDQEYPAARIADASAQYRPAFGLVDESLTMLEKPAVRLDLKQIDRAVGVDSFPQGHNGDLGDDKFDISKAGQLDLLVVVDDSKSMADEQANLATKLSALTKHLKNTDWRIAVITTSSCALRNGGKAINATDPTADVDFANAVNVGINGDSTERGILRAYQVFKGGSCDNKWLRPNAALGMLFISDEESFCGFFDCPYGSEPQHLVSLLKEKYKTAMLKAYALVWDSNNANCNGTGTGDESPGGRYVSMVSGLGGLSSSICEPDYTNVLERISLDVSRIVEREFALSYQPALADLVVTVDENPYTDFKLDGKKLKLSNVSSNALKLRVTYRYGPKPRFETVALTSALDPQSLRVFVDDVELGPEKFEYLEQENQIYFVEVPADKSTVKAKYRKNGSLPFKFDLAGRPMEDSFLRVELNGVEVETTSYQYDDLTEVLSFDVAPADGAVISVLTKSSNPQILNYAISDTVALEKVQTVAAVDAVSGEALAVTVEGEELVFAKDQVFENRQVRVTYDYGDKDLVLQHELAQDPLEGTVEVSVVSGDNACINSVMIEGRTLKYQCSAEALEEVRVGYKYVAEYFTDFVIDYPLDETTFISVWIDRMKTNDYTLNGNTVTISRELLNADSSVRIIVTK